MVWLWCFGLGIMEEIMKAVAREVEREESVRLKKKGKGSLVNKWIMCKSHDH